VDKCVVSSENAPQAIGPYSQGIKAGGFLFISGQLPVEVKDLNDFQCMNAIYGQFFPHAAPARACIQVAKLPKDVLVEIEAIAICQ